MEKKTKVQLVVEVLKSNPDITIKALAKKFKVSDSYAAVLRSQARSSLKQPEKLTEFKTQEHNIIQGYTGKQYEPMNFTVPLFEAPPDAVNHPPHYKKHASGVECIQITEHMNFCLGNAIKYIWRADHKGNTIEDLEKAEFYVRREIERRKNKNT
jgi:hypothetical protein